jgi:hypothetical protein
MVCLAMRSPEYLNWLSTKRLVALMIRPRTAVLRLRELWHASRSRQIRSDIDLSNLPGVTLQQAVTGTDLASVLDLYKRNPSRLIIAPCDRQALETLLSRKVVFYRILDKVGNHVGNLGYQCARRMFSYLQIDYRYRGGGYALAAQLEGERVVARQCVDCIYAQVFRENYRALSTYFSLGWKVDHEQSTQEYFTLTKALSLVGR